MVSEQKQSVSSDTCDDRDARESRESREIRDGNAALLRLAENNHMARQTSRWDVNGGDHTYPSKRMALGRAERSVSNGGDVSNGGVSNERESSVESSSAGIVVERDGVHQQQHGCAISPGQLYSTDSGRLFHAGKILIVLVGLPATSKTKLSVAITRYTRWLGVKSQAFHVSEYRRRLVPKKQKSVSPSRGVSKDGCVEVEEEGKENEEEENEGEEGIPQDYFSLKPQTKEGQVLRSTVLENCLKDIEEYFQDSNSQLAIYDALNIDAETRSSIYNRFAHSGAADSEINVLFIESIVDDVQLLERNIDIAVNSVDYVNWNLDKARKNYMHRINVNKKYYKHMDEKENLSFIKYINYGERLIFHKHNVNNYGYLVNKIVFFLMNLKEKKGKVYLSRCGTSDNDKYNDDEQLNEEGIRFSKQLTDVVLQRLGSESESFQVWTAPRKRTHDTSKFFQELHYSVEQRNQLKQLHPGEIADLSLKETRENFPHEYREFLKDPYHYRYPRAESYHDLAVRIEPLLMEIERMSGDVLIIAHESTLRVLYGYLMACTSSEIPEIEFTRKEVIEISFGHYENTAIRLPIDY